MIELDMALLDRMKIWSIKIINGKKFKQYEDIAGLKIKTEEILIEYFLPEK